MVRTLLAKVRTFFPAGELAGQDLLLLTEDGKHRARVGRGGSVEGKGIAGSVSPVQNPLPGPPYPACTRITPVLPLRDLHFPSPRILVRISLMAGTGSTRVPQKMGRSQNFCAISHANKEHGFIR